MIDFGLFCDIKYNVIETKIPAIMGHLTAGYRFKYFVDTIRETNESEDAIYELVQNCDKEMIQRLMLYFEKDAPVQKLLKARLKELNDQNSKKSIDEFLLQKKRDGKSFYQYLCSKIEEKSFESEADFYNYIGMSRQTFSKIRKPEYPISRNHAILMAVGLCLNYAEAEEFMKNAGFVFKSLDTREAIISYVMRNQKYDLFSMNEILYDFGEKPLIGE